MLFILLEIVEAVIFIVRLCESLLFSRSRCFLLSFAVCDRSCDLFSKWLMNAVELGAIYFWTCFSPVFGLVKE